MFRPSLYSTSGWPTRFFTPGYTDGSVLTQSMNPWPTFGNVTGSLPDGFVTPNNRSATMLPSSWPGNQTSSMAGPPAPRSTGSIATPALSLSTSAVFAAIGFAVVEVAPRMPAIIATVLLLAAVFEVAVESAFGLPTYHSRPSPTAVMDKPVESAKDARSAPSSATVPAMMITASAPDVAAVAAARS